MDDEDDAVVVAVAVAVVVVVIVDVATGDGIGFGFVTNDGKEDDDDDAISNGFPPPLVVRPRASNGLVETEPPPLEVVAVAFIEVAFASEEEDAAEDRMDGMGKDGVMYTTSDLGMSLQCNDHVDSMLAMMIDVVD